MKKGLLVVGLLFLLGLGYWQMSGNKSGTAPVTETAMEEFTGNLTAAMQKGVPMQCSWQSGADSGESFVKGQNMYVATKVEGKAGYMIKKDNCIWTWGNEQPQGFKFCTEPEAMTESETAVDYPDSGSYRAEGVDMNVEYKCRPALFGEDKFTPPATVEFADFEQMMKGAMPDLPSLPVEE